MRAYEPDEIPWSWRPRNTMVALSRLLIVLVAVLLLPASRAHAETTRGPSIRLDYAAPTGCPNRAAFFELVRLRAPHVELVEEAAEARRFIVSLEREEPLYRGKLAKPGDAARTLEGATCEEVARGLALIIAIELGPMTDAPSPSPPATVAAPRFPAPPSSPSPPARRLELAVLGGASLGVTSALATRAAPTVQAGLEVRSMSGPWFMRPSLRLAVSAAFAPEMRDREGTASATTATALMRACPLTIPGLGRRVAIDPCATVELGALFSKGSTPQAELATTSYWMTVGGGLHVLTWIRRRVFVDADLTLFAPLERYRSYLTRPEMALFETPPFGFRWSLGAGMRFQ